jgi:hypothetical protein
MEQSLRQCLQQQALLELDHLQVELLALEVLALVLLRHKQQQNFHLPFPLLVLELPLAWAPVLLQHKRQQRLHLVLVAPLLAVLLVAPVYLAAQ